MRQRIITLRIHGLRIRTIAPFSSRVCEVMREEKLESAAAERRVRHYDQEVRARVQHSLGVDLEDNSRYDLIVNTAAQPLNWFASMIIELASAIEHEADTASRQALKDACLSAQVRAALSLIQRSATHRLTSKSAPEVVVLKSAALVSPWDELATSIVRRVPGVVQVEPQIDEPPIPFRAE